ncbi:MAG: hypothetical protein ACHREM_11575 [Polyangiales bacterium]
MSAVRVAIATSLLSLLACGAAKSTPTNTLGDASTSNDSGSLVDSGGAHPEGGVTFDAALDLGPGTGGGSAAIYGHSSTTLYQLDPKTLVVTNRGDFVDTAGSSVSQVTDLALDKDGRMFVVTTGELYSVDYAGAAPKCTHLATLSTSFNGLTFVPAGMIDPSSEVLIGVAVDGGWWRVDVTAGAASAKLTQLGSYGGGWQSSGDAVGIIGDRVYATVTQDPFGATDHVVVVDPKTGAILEDRGDTLVQGFYGVGYWGGTMYGFAQDGSLYSIDPKTAKSTKIPITNAPNEWWGAGVTTSAPVTIH